MRLVVSGTLTLDGQITANGMQGSGWRAGGGSGGSIRASVGVLNGSGQFRADGGDSKSSYDGGGGGGRICVYVGTNEFGGNISVLGGTGYYSGASGTTCLTEDPTLNPNQPPVADAGGPYTVKVNDTVQLDASNTTDANQCCTTLDYRWDFDGDGVYGETGPAAERGDEVGITPTFDAAGLGLQSSVTVQLRVTDDGGLWDEDDAQIDVVGTPDLVVRSSGINFTPVHPDADEFFTIDAVVTNQGLAAVTGMIDVEFYDFESPGVPLGTAIIAGLLPGESVVVHSPEVSFPESYRVMTVVVDPADMIDEMNEENNEASQVVQIGTPEFDGAPVIVVEAPDDFSCCAGQPKAVTGQAFYDFPSVAGTHDFPVQGASVAVTVAGNTYTGSHTDVNGNLRQGILAPGTQGSYALAIEVTDGTAPAFTTSTLIVGDCPTPPLPTLPPSGDVGYPPGGGGTSPGGGGGEPIPGSPSLAGDVFIYSEDIVFSSQPQGVGDPISIFAFVQYQGDIPVSNIPVTINDVFPVGGELYTFPIGTSVIDFDAAPDESVFTVVEAPWINTAAGTHIIQVDLDPPFVQYTGNDQATRLIHVGTPGLTTGSIEKDVTLLNDADGDAVPSPGDTLHYTVTFTNIGVDDLNHVRIYDDYDERLLETPTNVSHEGTVADGRIVWEFAALTPSSVIVTFDAQIKPDDEFPGGITSVVNTAIGHSDEIAGIGDWAIIEVEGDRIPPNTMADLSTDPNAAGWNNMDVDLTLTAYDNLGGSGVDRILYSIDGAPAAEYTGPVTFAEDGTYTVYYQAIDVAGNYEAPQSIEIRIDKTPPAAVHAGPFSVPEGSSIQLDGTASADGLSGIASTAWAIDGDGLFDDGDPVTFTGIDGPATQAVSLRVVDGAGNEAIAHTQVEVLNVAPVAQNDAYEMWGDTLVVPSAAGVLVNDTDIVDESLTAHVVEPPLKGNLVLNTDGSFEYTPAANFDGIDSFTYVAHDGADDSNVAAVSITHQLYVRNTNDSGDGSLRWTIDNANGHAGPDTIRFAISPDDPGFVDVDSALAGGDADPDAFVIQPLTGLPTLNDSSGGTTIDGRSQAAFGGDTNPFGPEIAIHGGLTSSDGLQLRSHENAVIHLNIGGFNNGISVGTWQNRNSDRNLIQANYIGTDPTGTQAVPNGTGINISNASTGNLVGTDGNGLNDATEGNVISGNNGRGVFLLHNGTAQNTVAGNFIGVDATGQAALGNDTGVVGVPQYSVIGTNGDGVSDELERNVISGNRGHGIFFDGSTIGNIIAGNYIGTDVTGTVAIGNGPIHAGILLRGSGHRVGTDGDGVSDELERNVVAGNAGGISLQAGNCTVAGNYVGVDATGLAAMGNGGRGISVDGDDNIIGSNSDGSGDAYEGNVIAASIHDAGVWVGGDNNVLHGNLIGTDATGTTALGNARWGVWLAGHANRVGGTLPTQANVIADNSPGVLLSTSSNFVQGNFIGTDRTATLDLGNRSHGVVVSSQNNTIGGAGAAGASRPEVAAPAEGLLPAYLSVRCRRTSLVMCLRVS